jgi:hypothetical protein
MNRVKESQNLMFGFQEYEEKIESYNYYDELFKRELTDIREKNSGSLGFNLTWAFFDIDEQFITEQGDSDIFFTHTFPLSLGLKNFVFHFEDINMLFLPLIASQNKELSDLLATKDFDDFVTYLSERFLDEKCLAIFVHYSQTLVSFESMFNNKKILDKVVFLDILQLNKEAENLSMAPNMTQFEDKNKILFTHSAHGNPSTLTQRGLFDFLDFIEENQISISENNLVPTLLINVLPEIDPSRLKGVNIIEGFLPSKCYRRLLNETKFHFISSVHVHTRVLLDCDIYNITPVVRNLDVLSSFEFNAGKIIISDELINPLALCGTDGLVKHVDQIKLKNKFDIFINKKFAPPDEISLHTKVDIRYPLIDRLLSFKEFLNCLVLGNIS